MTRDFFFVALLICVAPPLVVLSAILITMVSQ